jgi:hypothetical protein
MKTFVSLLTCTFIICNVHGQNETKAFKPFRVNLNVGVPIQTGKGFKEGLSLSIEPKYDINDRLQLGLRMELAIMARVVEYPNSTYVDANVSDNGSFNATADYYFSLSKLRPFAGIGAGSCVLASANLTFDANNQLRELEINGERKFECMIRTGIEFGHGRLAFEYNYIPKTTIPYSTVIIRNSYFNIKLGVAIGGGRLKK